MSAEQIEIPLGVEGGDCAKHRKKLYQTAYYMRNREEYLAKARAYGEANKERIKAQKKIWYEANRDRWSAQKKAAYEANRDLMIARCKSYREANKEKIKMNRLEYYQAKRKIMAGMIYAIAGLAGIKIGRVTKQSVKKRLNGIRDGDPTAKIIMSIPVADVYAEIELHRMFRHSRVGGEWFNITHEEAIAAIQEVAQKYNTAA